MMNLTTIKNSFLQLKNKRFTLFCIIIIFGFTFYFLGTISDGLNTTRVYYSDFESYEYLDVTNSTTIPLEVKSSNLNELHLIYHTELENPTFNLTIDGIDPQQYSISTENNIEHGEDSYLLISFFKAINKKSLSTLTLNISSSDILLKVDEQGSLINKQFGLPKLFIFICCFLFALLVFGFSCLIFYTQKLKINKRYLLFSALLGVMALFIRPPCSQYDDLIHYDTTYNMSNIILGLGNAQETGILLKRQCDLNLLPDYYPDNYYIQYNGWHDSYRGYYIHAAKNFSFHPDTSLIPSKADKVTKPQRAFFFTALAISLGRLLGLNQFLLYYFGAFCNLCLCCFLIFLGLKKNNDNHSFITAIIALFPAVILLFASYSYDALLISTSFTIINYSLALYNQKEKKIIDIIILGVLSLFILPIKTVYFLIPAFILLLFFFNKEKNIKRNLLLLFGSVILVYILMFILALTGKVSFLQNQSPSYTDNSKLTYPLSFSVLHPLKFMKIIISTFLNESYTNSIDDLFFYVPHSEYSLPIMTKLYLVFFFLFLFSNESQRKINKSIFISSLFIFLAISFLLYLVGLVWTPQGATQLWGIQARYFLPILPFLFIATKQIPQKLVNFNDNHCFIYCSILSFFYFIGMFISFIF